jgi:hypothetical protein
MPRCPRTGWPLERPPRPPRAAWTAVVQPQRPVLASQPAQRRRMRAAGSEQRPGAAAHRSPVRACAWPVAAGPAGALCRLQAAPHRECAQHAHHRTQTQVRRQQQQCERPHDRDLSCGRHPSPSPVPFPSLCPCLSLGHGHGHGHAARAQPRDCHALAPPVLRPHARGPRRRRVARETQRPSARTRETDSQDRVGCGQTLASDTSASSIRAAADRRSVPHTSAHPDPLTETWRSMRKPDGMLDVGAVGGDGVCPDCAAPTAAAATAFATGLVTAALPPTSGAGLAAAGAAIGFFVGESDCDWLSDTGALPAVAAASRGAGTIGRRLYASPRTRAAVELASSSASSPASGAASGATAGTARTSATGTVAAAWVGPDSTGDAESIVSRLPVVPRLENTEPGVASSDTRSGCWGTPGQNRGAQRETETESGPWLLESRAAAEQPRRPSCLTRTGRHPWGVQPPALWALPH